MRYVFALVFSGLTAAALAGAPPQQCESCKPAPVAEKAAGCSGEGESCSGRRTFAKRRADRLAARCAAREARQEARSCACAKACSGEPAKACDCK
jgi:hypothetical protein